jgi:multidrug efflux pump subunit AcrB
LDVASDQADSGRSLTLRLDREAATRLGVSVQAIDDVLYDAFGQRFVSTIYTQLNQYRVILTVKAPFAADAQALSHVYVPSTLGAPVPLLSVATPFLGEAPLTVSHQGQFPAVTLSFNLAPHVSLSQATSAIEAAGRSLNVPSSVRARFVGTAEAFGEALAHEPPLIAAAVGVVYVVLGVLYESAIHPITILSTLPSAGVGALLALWLLGFHFDMMALIGVILLIGIVKKNAIMMIDVALVQERTLGQTPQAAIRSACLLRFRPIMMTTCAALLGALPLALGLGVGAELRQPMGISIVGGLAISQLLTLFTTPVVYLAMGRLGAALARLRGRRP